MTTNKMKSVFTPMKKWGLERRTFRVFITALVGIACAGAWLYFSPLPDVHHHSEHDEKSAQAA